MLTKRCTRRDIDEELQRAAQIYRWQLARIDPRPQNLIWIAGTIRGQIKTATPEERVALYWSLGVVFWTAGRKDLARKAVRIHLRLRPRSDLDVALDDAQVRLRTELLKIGIPTTRPGRGRRRLTR